MVSVLSSHLKSTAILLSFTGRVNAPLIVQFKDDILLRYLMLPLMFSILSVNWHFMYIPVSVTEASCCCRYRRLWFWPPHLTVSSVAADARQAPTLRTIDTYNLFLAILPSNAIPQY